MRESKQQLRARIPGQPDLGEKIPATLLIETRNSPNHIRLGPLDLNSHQGLYEVLRLANIDMDIIWKDNNSSVFIDIKGHKNIRKMVASFKDERFPYEMTMADPKSLQQYTKFSLRTWAAELWTEFLGKVSHFYIFDTSDIAEFFRDIVEFFSDMGKAISSLFTKSQQENANEASLEELVANANLDRLTIHKILAHKGSTAEEKIEAIMAIFEEENLNFDLNVADENNETPLQKLTERDRGGEQRGYHHSIPAAQAEELYRPFSLLLLDQLISNADSDPSTVHKILAHKGSTAEEKIKAMAAIFEEENLNFDLNFPDEEGETPLQKLTERDRGSEQRGYHHSIPAAQAAELYRPFSLLLLAELVVNAPSDPSTVHKILAHKGSTAQEKIEAIENVLDDNPNFDLNFVAGENNETPLQKLTRRDRRGEQDNPNGGYHHSIPKDQAGALRTFFGQHQPSFIATVVTPGFLASAASRLFWAGVGNDDTPPKELQSAQSSDSTIPQALQNSSQANSSSSPQSAGTADQPNSSWMEDGVGDAALVMAAGVMGLLSVIGVGVGLAAIAVAATRGQSATPTSPSGETQHTQNSWWGGMFSPRHQEQGQPSSHNTLPTLRN